MGRYFSPENAVDDILGKNYIIRKVVVCKNIEKFFSSTFFHRFRDWSLFANDTIFFFHHFDQLWILNSGDENSRNRVYLILKVQ